MFAAAFVGALRRSEIYQPETDIITSVAAHSHSLRAALCSRLRTHDG